MSEFVQTDLPEPVVPATRTCGKCETSPMIRLPLISSPTANAVVDLCPTNSSDSSSVRMDTGLTVRFGTSMPTTDCLSGMGAMRTPTAPSANAISSCRFVILESLTPAPSLNS